LKDKSVLIVFIIVIFTASFAFQANAEDISIGGTALYQWWRPAWNNGKIITYSPQSPQYIDYTFPLFPVFRQFRYGPSLTLKFLRNWEISTEFFYGKTSGNTNGAGLGPDPLYRTVAISITEHDMHASIGYYALDYLKVFAGLRVGLLNTDITYNHISLMPDFFHLGLKGEMLNFTPELGVHFVVPVTEIISLRLDLSGTFQFGSDKQNYNVHNIYHYDPSGLRTEPVRFPRAQYRAIGGNSFLSVKINVPETDVSLIAGAYYRLLRYFQKNSERGLFILNRSLDHTYGMSLTAAYRFSIDTHRHRKIWMPRPSMDE
jgi:hypothetical protein